MALAILQCENQGAISGFSNSTISSDSASPTSLAEAVSTFFSHLHA